MADFQWLAMPIVAIIALIIIVYFGVHNLRNIVTRQDRDAGYASGRVDAKLETVEGKLESVEGRFATVDAKLETVEQLVRTTNAKLEAHDLILTEMRGETKKLSRRVRKLSKRVEALESGDAPSPGPSAGPAVVTGIQGGRST